MVLDLKGKILIPNFRWTAENDNKLSISVPMTEDVAAPVTPKRGISTTLVTSVVAAEKATLFLKARSCPVICRRIATGPKKTIINCPSVSSRREGLALMNSLPKIDRIHSGAAMKTKMMGDVIVSIINMD